MSSIKPRVKVPKEVSIDEIVEIKTLIRHPMHSGRMKDADGQTIPRQIINFFSAKFNGKDVLPPTQTEHSFKNAFPPQSPLQSCTQSFEISKAS